MARRNGLGGKYPQSFCEWVVGTTIENAIAAQERKRAPPVMPRTRQVIRVEVTTDDEAEEDKLQITYPRTGQQVTIARPKTDTVIKKVRFEGVPIKSAMKKLVEVAPDVETEAETSSGGETTSGEETSESDANTSDAASSIAESSNAESSDAETSEAETSEAESSEAESSEAKSSQDESSDSEPVKTSKKQKKGGNACTKCARREKKKKQAKKEAVSSDSEPSEDSETSESEAEDKAEKKKKKKGKQQEQQPANPKQEKNQKQGKKQQKDGKNKQQKGEGKKNQTKTTNGNGKAQEANSKAQEANGKGEGEEAKATGNDKAEEAAEKTDAPKETADKAVQEPPAAEPVKPADAPAPSVIRAEQVVMSPNDPPPNAYYDPLLGIVRYSVGPQYNHPPYPSRDSSGYPLPYGMPHPMHGPWPNGPNQPQPQPQVPNHGQEHFPSMSGAIPNQMPFPYGDAFTPRVQPFAYPKPENEQEQMAPPLTLGMPVPSQYAMSYPPGMSQGYNGYYPPNGPGPVQENMYWPPPHTPNYMGNNNMGPASPPDKHRIGASNILPGDLIFEKSPYIPQRSVFGSYVNSNTSRKASSNKGKKSSPQPEAAVIGSDGGARRSPRKKSPDTVGTGGWPTPSPVVVNGDKGDVWPSPVENDGNHWSSFPPVDKTKTLSSNHSRGEPFNNVMPGSFDQPSSPVPIWGDPTMANSTKNNW